MTNVEQLEREVRSLSPDELATFREWFAAFDAAAWDRQMEGDVKAGRLDVLADAALAAHRAGRSQKLVRAMSFVAVAYVVIGIVFGVLDNSADANQVRLWRLAAWVASAAVAAAHLGYEHFRLGTSPRPTALHAAAAVALGAFGLALAANVHWLFAATHGQRPPLLALPVWPVITAVPAFLVALAVAAVLARLSRRA